MSSIIYPFSIVIVCLIIYFFFHLFILPPKFEDERFSFFKRKWLFWKVKKIINEEDPVGLLALGAPVDEYHIEIENIVEEIESGINYPYDQLFIIRFFEHWFYPGCITEEAALVISKRLENLHS